MPNYIDLAQPSRLLQSVSAMKLAGMAGTWSDPFDSVEHARLSAISGRYRKYSGSGTASTEVTEMTQAEKDAVDAAAVTAADDAEMVELRAYVYALKKQVRRELNAIRAQVDLVAGRIKTQSYTAAGQPADLGDLVGGAFTASIRTRLEEL